jgi:hypothetical protein
MSDSFFQAAPEIITNTYWIDGKQKQIQYFREDKITALRDQLKLAIEALENIWALAKHDDKMIEAVCKETLAKIKARHGELK